MNLFPKIFFNRFTADFLMKELIKVTKDGLNLLLARKHYRNLLYWMQQDLPLHKSDGICLLYCLVALSHPHYVCSLEAYFNYKKQLINVH